MKFLRQTEALEPVDQIVGEQKQVEVGFVGEEVMAGDVPQGVISLKLANDQFDTSAVIVEAPKVERLQRQIGDQNLVVVAAELEQRQLLSRLLGLEAANDYEADKNKVRAAIKKAGTISSRQLQKKIPKLKAKELSGMIEELADTGEVTYKNDQTGGRPSKNVTWIG